MSHAHDYLEELGDIIQDLTREEQLLTFRDYGEKLHPLDDKWKEEHNMVPGCASATHLVCRIEDDGTLHFEGDSQSLISKGYLYVLIEAFNGSTPEELVKDAESYVMAFAEKAQVKMSIVPSRANAFQNIFMFMQKKAIEALAQAG